MMYCLMLPLVTDGGCHDNLIDVISAVNCRLVMLSGAVSINQQLNYVFNFCFVFFLSRNRSLYFFSCLKLYKSTMYCKSTCNLLSAVDSIAKEKQIW